MSALIEVVDETAGGEVIRRLLLKLESRDITVREIIERRVREEVERFNAAPEEFVFHGLVQPHDTERELNGYRMRRRRLLDADRQCALALEAFAQNGFFMLVGDRQVETLDETIAVTPELVVSFVKLVPLVGG